MFTAIAIVVGVMVVGLAGGYGGYRYGAAAERKAMAVVKAAKGG